MTCQLIKKRSRYVVFSGIAGEMKMKLSEKFSIGGVVFIALIPIGAIGGYIANIFKMISALGGEVTTLFIARCVGIFVAPLGSILGFF